MGFFGRRTGSERRDGGDSRARIDHPHYVSADEYECGACGRRFRKNAMACPYCGTRFERRIIDKDEYDDEVEEELEMDEWDEEDGL